MAKELRRLEELAAANPDDASARYELGLWLWNSTNNHDKAKAAEHFVAAARLDPQNAAVFRHLGDYYSHYSSEPSSAAKCYQRAVSLDPLDSHSGDALCDLLDGDGKESLELTMCRGASLKSPRAFWAFRRLGYLQLHRREWSDAVQSLQHAIRGYPACHLLWEALGLAYHRLARFTAALKSYGRAAELDPAAVFPLLQSGNVYLLLVSYGEAVEQFRKAMRISPGGVSASYGLASALLGLANQQISAGASRWAATLLEEASQVAKATTGLAANLSSSWKLLGDIQLTYARCYPWSGEEESRAGGLEAFKTSILSWRQTCRSAAVSAKHSYQRALLLAPSQPNIYMDIAFASRLITAHSTDLAWQLPEKMALGALSLEIENYDFWVSLGYLSDHIALKQHAFIRGLQLHVSLSVAWAYLGKLYRREDEKQLARQAFDTSRSIDPLLALPWAGMSADFHAGESAPDEAFESCLRAVQVLPLAEFQIGLAKLAAVSGNLSFPQVFGAIRQAVQQIPHYPEAFNLQGLVFEARLDYQSAAASYRLAHCAVTAFSSNVSKFQLRDISVNLARSLSKAGNAEEAVHECENLRAEGLLDTEGLQIYALSLWRLGQSKSALSVAKNLAAGVPTMEHHLTAASVSLVCQLLYCISGLDSSVNSILKMPKELFQSSRISFIVSAIHALDRSNRLESVVASSRQYVRSQEDVTKMHSLIALSKLIKSGTEYSLGFLSGVAHLRKVLHIYPNSDLLRNLLGYFLLCGEDWNGTHLGIRCCSGDASSFPINCLKSHYEILGAGGVSCYALCSTGLRFSFPTCTYQCPKQPSIIQLLQKCLRREPWNQTVRYLLILNLAQKAREERFPCNICVTLERLIRVAISDECYSKMDSSFVYQKFLLLLCASEISLQCGNQGGCVKSAKKAALLTLPDSSLFFAHLLLCRAYALADDIVNLQREYIKCLELKTDCHIGWICLRIIESQYVMQDDSGISELTLNEYLVEGTNKQIMWLAIFNLVQGLISLSKQDLLLAEEYLRRGFSLASSESCLRLCHGATCLELAKQWPDSQLLLLAVQSLIKAREVSAITPLPYVSALLAQAEGSLGSKAKWENNLRLEWYAWPPEMRPAELFFQIHLLAKQWSAMPESSNVENCQSPRKWVLRAIHTNPSCMRYWKILHQLDQ